MRHFTDHIAPNYKTIETPKELRQRTTQRSKEAQKRIGTQNQTLAGENISEVVASGSTAPNVLARGPRQKIYNLKRVKFHLLGHLPESIQSCGPSDVYTSGVVSLTSFFQFLYYDDSSVGRGQP
jgi:hypothetical protein